MKLSKVSEIYPRGMVRIYTGEGQGKTTAAFGLALRALGRGLKVFVVQFLKGRESGEVLSLRKLGGQVELFGRKEFVDSENIKPQDQKLAKEGLKRAKEVIQSGKYDLVILDEICVALKFGLVEGEEVKRLMEEKPKNLELVLTGRYCPQDLIKIADLVTQMKKVKHPFDKGMKAREGFEF